MSNMAQTQTHTRWICGVCMQLIMRWINLTAQLLNIGICSRRIQHFLCVMLQFFSSILLSLFDVRAIQLIGISRTSHTYWEREKQRQCVTHAFRQNNKYSKVFYNIVAFIHIFLSWAISHENSSTLTIGTKVQWNPVLHKQNKKKSNHFKYKPITMEFIRSS